MPNVPERQRLFFALWPEAGLRAHIQQAIMPALRAYQARPIDPANWHVTLVFIGTVEAETVACLQRVAGECQAPAFSLCLDRLGFWPRPQVVWLAPSLIPPELAQLQTALSAALAGQCAYRPEARPYRPHLSLLRKATSGPAEQAITPVEWPVRHFGLVRSKSHNNNVLYELVNSWPLVPQP